LTLTLTLALERSHHFVAICVRGRGGACGDAELAEDVADVSFDGALADEQPRGDVAVRHAGSDESEHLELASRQRVTLVCRLRRCSRELIDARDVRCGAYLFERPARGLEVECCAIRIAETRARLCNEHASARGFVRRFQFFPQTARTTQVVQRDAAVAACEQQCTASMLRNGIRER